jgi:esterase/lipase
MAELSGIGERIAAAEALVPELRAGCEKQIVWAGKPDSKTPISVLFVHGFSASSGELKPLPERVAEELNANLFLTRLRGHGQNGAEFGKATYEEWLSDTIEAIEIAATIGDRVVVIGCSTGCTLLSLAMSQGQKPMASVFISPNFGLRHRIGQFLLDLPGIRYFGHLIVGKERSFPVLNEAHAKYWTTSYPISAVYAMRDAVIAARKIRYEQIKTPVMFVLNDDDQVINPKVAKSVMKSWGGPTQHLPLQQTADDDKMGHVMVGDAFSPNQTEPLVRRMLDWLHSI